MEAVIFFRCISKRFPYFFLNPLGQIGLTPETVLEVLPLIQVMVIFFKGAAVGVAGAEGAGFAGAALAVGAGAGAS